MIKNLKRSQWLDYLLLLLIPVIGMALGFATTILFGINKTEYSSLVINLFFLGACLILLSIFKFTRRDLGLEIIREQTKMHVFFSLVIFMLYIFFYVFIIRISVLKPFSSSAAWGLLTYFVVVITEELYFRGILYGFFQKRFSAQRALIVSSMIFGFFHASQGLRGIVSKALTGWLWGSVRYSSGMIFLLIFPVHFAYNSIWLLFEGNWNNPPMWAIYALPVAEFVLGYVILLHANRRNQGDNHVQTS